MKIPPELDRVADVAAHAEPMADIDDELIASLARRLRELRAYAAHSQGCSGEPCVCGLERLIGA